MQNIEFKAELRDFDAAVAQCAALGAQRIAALRQEDTYFRLADGRLKRRQGITEPTVWIYYHRPDTVRPRMCNYTILNDEQAKLRWGTCSLQQWVTVTKTRHLWLMEGVRIHIDRVDDLGDYIEFEAMVTRAFDVKACHQSIFQLRETFAPILGEPVGVSY
ncbi:MAG: class IV adenylate cyclase, partial [Phycisphaerales bacterium]|nr:class IV adenylate cyclase [Phycisphaerales bacterium]